MLIRLFRIMNINNENSYSQGYLEDSFIRQISTTKMSSGKFEHNKQDEEDSLEQTHNYENKSSSDLSIIEEIANKISTYR